MLVDTNIVSAHFKGDPVVMPKLQAADVIYLPSIVLGELIFGAHKSPNWNYGIRLREQAQREMFDPMPVGLILRAMGRTRVAYGRLLYRA